jgi:DGQHR domain-containing protein
LAGWIVDGQQRAAALRDADIARFPVCVTAFITDHDDEQRAQFILVNSTKPLPKGLIYELLPETSGALPRHLRFRRFPAYLLERLNHAWHSPFRLLINTPTTPEGVIKDNSILRMLESSLTDGALYHLRDPKTGKGDVDAMLTVLKNYWSAVRDLYPVAWGVSPRRSRLMHGAGIVSMGLLMDAICDRFLPDRYPTYEEFTADLALIAPVCKWTSGYWEFRPVQRRWNDLQNTPRDIQLLADYLLGQYVERVVRPPHLRVAT